MGEVLRTSEVGGRRGTSFQVAPLVLWSSHGRGVSSRSPLWLCSQSWSTGLDRAGRKLVNWAEHIALSGSYLVTTGVAYSWAMFEWSS